MVSVEADGSGRKAVYRSGDQRPAKKEDMRRPGSLFEMIIVGFSIEPNE